MDTVSVLLEQWAGRLGDTTFWGWLITLFYGIATIAAVYYVIILSRSHATEKKILWICITVVLIVFGINKQLDLQILLTIAGRAVASAQGWLAYRRVVQKIFAVGIFGSIGMAGIVALWYTRRVLVKSWLELLGTAILLGFVLIRTASMSHVNKAIRFEQNRISHIHAIELLGLLIILAAVYFHIIRAKKKGAG